ncbi:MAG: lysophospholipid acyltransferase family protein [Planctomycetota bacterium]|jgi:KDO2-lipid IV(A) lauroyltransferase
MAKPKKNSLMRSRPVEWLVCLFVKFVLAIMQMFPVDWNLGTARLLSKIWILVLPRHLKRAMDHLRLAYGDEMPERQMKRVAEKSLASLVMFAIEVACLPRLINRFTWSRYLSLTDFDDVLRVIAEGRGAILVTGHYGSFELIGHLLAALGFDTVAVMRPLDNKDLNDYLVQTRRRNGLQLLDKKGAMNHSEHVLERGGLLAFIADQDAGRKGVFVDFFGVPASTYKSIGLLAMQSGRPIVVGSCRRVGKRARYEVCATRIIRPEEWENQADPLRFITEEYTRAIEAFVRADPEQYLWIHRRWKSQPGRKRKKKGAVSTAT